MPPQDLHRLLARASASFRCADVLEGTSRFSSTVMLRNGRGIWKLRAMPRRVRW